MTQSSLKQLINEQVDENFTQDLKFVYSVPQVVDPDPLTCIIEPSKNKQQINYLRR